MEDKSLIALIETVSKSRIHLNGTDEVFHLEAKLAAYFGKKHCLLMTNGTMALYSLAVALNLKDGDILVPGFGWPGSIAPFLFFNNTVSLCPVDENYCLDPERIEEFITPTTTAILSIDMGGSAADSRRISEIAQRYGVMYISDSAQSLGAMRDGQPAGIYSEVLITSFTYGKPICAGEGGAILTNDDHLYHQLLYQTQHAYRQKKWFGINGWNPFSPLNCRIHPISAILALYQFEHLSEIMEERQKKAVTIIKAMIDQGILNKSAMPEMLNNTTFFEFYSRINKKGKTLPSLCEGHEWHLDLEMDQYNLYKMLLERKPDLIYKGMDCGEQFKDVVRIRFEF